MAISIPLDLGNAANASTLTLSITTLNPVAAGDLIILGHYASSTTGFITSATFTDSAGNIYQKPVIAFANPPLGEVGIAAAALPMAAGGTITCNFLGAAMRHVISAMTVSGMLRSFGCFNPGAAISPVPVTAAAAPSVSGHPVYSTMQLALGFLMAGASLGTVTPGGAWTPLGGTNTATGCLLPYYQILNTITDPLVWAPTFVNSVLHRSIFVPFTGQPGSIAAGQGARGLVTGVFA
jgi:hypothetical protein